MSEPWKGWMSKHTLENNASGYVYTGCRIPSCKPVLVTPIEDESLPHPGDGKEWETAASKRLVEVVAVSGHYAWVRLGDNDPGFLHGLETLRERKPEPEHKPWCKAQKCHPSYACTCERRSEWTSPYAQLPDGTPLFRRYGSMLTLHPDERDPDRRQS